MSAVQFLPDVPADAAEVYLISGDLSTRFRNRTFLVVPEIVNDVNRPIAFEIRYEYKSGPFKTAIRYGKFLAVGHEAWFYLFDLEKKEHALTINLNTYFSSVREHEDHLYVLSADGVYCVSREGVLIWRNTSLGIDGVIVDTFDEEYISGKAEWDPPDGWRNFKVKKLTGLEVDEPF